MNRLSLTPTFVVTDGGVGGGPATCVVQTRGADTFLSLNVPRIQVTSSLNVYFWFP